MSHALRMFPALLATLSLTASICSAQTAATGPVGVQTLTINPGLSTVGLPLLRPVVGSGTVQSSAATVITGTTVDVDYGSMLDAATAYYLEITEGPVSTYIGDRFEVDVATTIASGGNQIAVNTSSANNTTPGNLPDLSGYNFVVRPHLTIGYVFGTKGNTPMFGASTAAAADQIQFWNTALNGGNGAYETYYLAKFDTVEEWRKDGGGSTNYDNAVIPPGVGMFVRRNGTVQVQIAVAGDVRTSLYFAQNLEQGLNLISEGYPVDASPTTRACTTANGWTASSFSWWADKVQVWNPSLGDYDDYYYGKVRGVNQWRKSGGGTTNYDAVTIFKFGGATLVDKISAQPDYAAPRPF